MSTINDILAAVDANEFSYANRYQVLLPSLGSNQDGQNFAINCETVSFPDRSIASFPLREAGPIRKLPYMQIYGDITMGFYCSRDMKERVFFEHWQRLVYNEDLGNHKYYNDYTREVRIDQLDKQDNITYRIVLEDAWPTLLSEVTLGYANGSDVQRMSVTLSYTKWKQDSLKRDPAFEFLI